MVGGDNRPGFFGTWYGRVPLNQAPIEEVTDDLRCASEVGRGNLRKGICVLLSQEVPGRSVVHRNHSISRSAGRRSRLRSTGKTLVPAAISA